MVFEAAYGEGTPLGGSVYSHNLEKLSAADVLAYRSRNFTAGNLVIAADGVALSVLEQAAIRFAGAATNVSSPYTGGCVRRRADFGGDVHVALAFPTQSGAQSGAFRVLHSILTSQLRQKTKGSELGCVSTAMEGGLECVFLSASSTTSAETLLSVVVGELKAIAADASKASAVARSVRVGVTYVHPDCTNGYDRCLSTTQWVSREGLVPPM